MQTSTDPIEKISRETILEILNTINEKAEFFVSLIEAGKHRLVWVVFEEISSTLNISGRWPSQLLNDTDVFVFIAKQQSRGQGQSANSVWLSPPGNILVTIVLKLAESELIGLPQLGSLAVCELLEKHGYKDTRIKWINDVIGDDKKLGGNLIHTTNMPDDSFAVQIGIGVNIMAAPLEGSTCLINLHPGNYNVAQLTEQLIKLLLIMIDKANKEGIAHFYSAVEKRMLYLKEQVYIYDMSLSKIEYEGVFTRLGHEFEAELTTSTGPITLHNGRMRNKIL